MKRPPPPALLAEIEWRLHNYPVTAQAVSQLLAIARNNIYMGADSHLQIERILKAATANRFWPTNDKRVAVLYLRGEALCAGIIQRRQSCCIGKCFGIDP